MNILGYRVNDQNGMSVELTIDGEPLATLVGARDSWIPYWLFGDGLPVYEEGHSGSTDAMRIIAVCSCGEYGCGCTVCRVGSAEKDVVAFRGFDMDVGADGSTQEFLVARQNYEAVISGILESVRAFNNTREHK
jgi:hypothetical protein